MLQTPAFLCRQTDFIHAVAQAGKPVNIKKGQFLSPWDMKNVVDKAREQRAGSRQHHGVRARRSASATTTSSPTCARSRSCARPAARWCSTPRIRCSCRAGRARRGGQREFVPVLARAAVAGGVAGMFMETHPESGQGAVRRPERVAARTYARRCSKRLIALDAMVKQARFRGTIL